jgi:hypothetical protein
MLNTAMGEEGRALLVPLAPPLFVTVPFLDARPHLLFYASRDVNGRFGGSDGQPPGQNKLAK